MLGTGRERAIVNLNIENSNQFHEDTHIAHITWLSKRRTTEKAHSSIIVQFDHPGDANTAITKGLIWNGEPKTCEIYDHRLRMLQCSNYHSYGHNGTRCRQLRSAATVQDHIAKSSVTLNRDLGGVRTAKVHTAPGVTAARDVSRRDMKSRYCPESPGILFPPRKLTQVVNVQWEQICDPWLGKGPFGPLVKSWRFLVR